MFWHMLACGRAAGRYGKYRVEIHDSFYTTSFEKFTRQCTPNTIARRENKELIRNGSYEYLYDGGAIESSLGILLRLSYGMAPDVLGIQVRVKGMFSYIRNV